MHTLSIVISTVCRRSLIRAMRSIFVQTYQHSMQILIGIDSDQYGKQAALREQFARECPPHISILWIDIGYSTSVRHGGVHACRFGGSLRSALTFLASSQLVMYLDDDDWLHHEHVQAVMDVIGDNSWAFAYSIYADGNRSIGLCVDDFESGGVDQGVFKEDFGGFVRPSGMLINKMKLLPIIHLWSCAKFPTGDGEDRLIFERLRLEPHACTGQASVYYALDPKDCMHAQRMAFMRSRGVDAEILQKIDSTRSEE